LAIGQQREVLWLPFHRGQDRGLLSRLQSEGLLPDGLAEQSRELEVRTPQEAMEVAAGAGLLLAMRLHALILGSLAGAPCAALSYDPKVAAAAAGLGCPCVDLAMQLEAQSLVASWSAGLDRPVDPMAIQKQVVAAGCHQRVLAGLL
jgi:polysaccharide pyruvyl transferase WcaK-like protein